MYLSRLELHGFKSFAERTILQFDPGITAIVGPNGCGKSNIVDAVRWVIGEQRARVLRSEKMENVIFNGTSRRRPVGMAEVLLTVENTRGVLPIEYSEVTLGRRLYRSGDSDYLLNNTPCRLKDITDLFMDTGMGAGAYSVIELKMVEEILSENAQDRRRLFEEAAGVTRYKLRRRQTLGKLDSTQVDLNRVRDLTEEVEKQVRSLKRQAEKAARHREYSERLRGLELALAQLEHDRLAQRLAELSVAADAVKADIQRLEAEERTHDATLASLRQRLEEAEFSLKDARDALARQVAAERTLESEQRLVLERLDAAHRERDRLRAEASDDQARRDTLEAERTRLQTEATEAEPAADAAGEKLQAATTARDESQRRLASHRSQLDLARKAEREIQEKHGEARRRHDRQNARVDFLEAENDRLATERRQLDEMVTSVRARAEAALDSFEHLREELESARREADAVASTRDDLVKRLEEARGVVRTLERTREGALAESQVLENLVASFEEFPDAVRFLAETAEADAVPVTVADVVSSNAELRTALDAALGEYATCVIVERTADVAAAARRLEEAERGRATFIVLERVDRSRLPSPPETAPFATLLDGVEVREPYALVAWLLLGDVLVADGRPSEIAQDDIPAGCRLVTRDGEFVTSSGIMHTGSFRQTSSPLTGRIERREQLEAVRDRLTDLDRGIEAATAETSEVEAAIAALPVESTGTKLKAAERALAEAEKEEARAAYERETAERRISEHETRMLAIGSELETLRVSLAEDVDTLNTLESETARIRDTRAEREVIYREAEDAAASASVVFNEANVAAIQARNRVHNLKLDLQRTDSALQALSDRHLVRERQTSDLEERVAGWQDELDALRAKSTAAAEAHRPAEELLQANETRVAELKAGIAAEDERLRALRIEREAAIRVENGHAVQRAETKTRLDDLLDNTREDMGVDLEVDAVDTTDVDETSARHEVQDLRQKIRAIGAVNELALESYHEEKERLDFLVEQQRDLEHAEKTLLETIKEINTTASRRFTETYEAIQDSFKRIFVDLFGEDAAAELSLVDPSDPLETAIEITAKPRGKRPSTIAQLSGGEKTLTAIALLFAIYLVKPSPFCILDEVDAPLDDANVERFMSLIRSFAEETQFILVTHNKRTMEAADRLYGITMQEQGVSKLVGVRFEEAVELVG
jgi:chromosome segregation protein